MYMLNLLLLTIKMYLNTLVDILADLLLLHQELIIMMVKMSPFTTIVMKITSSFPKPFLLLNSSKSLSSIYPKNISKWFVIMEFMPNIIAMKVNWACLYQKKKDASSSVKMLGERLFPCHFILIHSCASVVMKWLFFNFTLKALRFLKITRIWLILLNVLSKLTQNSKYNQFN